jgi:hypothetical protein
MAYRKTNSHDDYEERVELANSISIVDYARKNGMEIIYEDESIAITIDEDTEHDLIIYKENNSWRLDKEAEPGDMNDIVYGNTVRFAARKEKIYWKDAIEVLVTDRGKYQSSEEYNSAYEKDEVERLNNELLNMNIPVNSNDTPEANKPSERNNEASLNNVPPQPRQQNQTSQQTVNTTSEVNRRNMNPIPPNQQVIPFPPQQQNGYRRTFTKEQMAEILAGVKKGLNVAAYDNIYLRPEQMKQIRLGMQKGIDPTPYSYPFVPAEYMKEMRLAIQKGLDISLLAIRDNRCVFHPDQAREIRIGMEKGLSMSDIQLYARPYLHPEVMKEIRLGLQDGIQQMKELNAGNYTAKDIHTIRTTILINKLLEAIAVHAKNLYEKILDLFQKIIEKKLYAANDGPEEGQDKYFDQENEVQHEMKAAATQIYNAMEESMEELPTDEKIIVFTDAVRRVASKAAAMEQSLDAEPSVIMVQSIQDIVEAQAEFALKQQAAENLMDEYVNDFNLQEESYNIKHVEFSTKVMTDHGLTQEQKTEIIKETLGSMYGEMVADIWVERISQESKLLQEQTRAKMVMYQDYEQQFAEVQLEEVEYSMEP